ncbi:hypothetical protein AAVH_13024 [Aphelenchoides avenae]|nr:hypothetical protein AAVH_13024 [Aphelenchus avenae]
MDYTSSCTEAMSGLTTPALAVSLMRARRIHYCDNCKDKDVMPESCKMLANAEAQERIRQNNANLKVKCEALQDELLRITVEVDAVKKEEATDAVEREDTASHAGRYVWYNGERAPCNKCERIGRRNNWCQRCRNLLNNSASAKSRRKKEEAAKASAALVKRAIAAEIRAEVVMKLSNCKDKVIRDHAFCPDCVKCFANAEGSSYSTPSNAAAWPQSPSSTPSSYISVRTTACAIVDWPSLANEAGCYGAALNFYRNFDRIQYQLAAPVTQGLRCNYTTKSMYNALANDCVLVMRAIMNHNHYEPLVGIHQLNLENELVVGCFQVVMMLHRIFLTSQFFGKYDETHLMLTSGTCIDLKAIDPYLRDFIPSADERLRYVRQHRQKMQHWESARRIAMEMAELGVSINDVAFLIFLVIVEEESW